MDKQKIISTQMSEWGKKKKGVKEKKSKWKVVTSRLNGKKGGRPKKK